MCVTCVAAVVIGETARLSILVHMLGYRRGRTAADGCDCHSHIHQLYFLVNLET